jgi:hypothetical protein
MLRTRYVWRRYCFSHSHGKPTRNTNTASGIQPALDTGDRFGHRQLFLRSWAGLLARGGGDHLRRDWHAAGGFAEYSWRIRQHPVGRRWIDRNHCSDFEAVLLEIPATIAC